MNGELSRGNRLLAWGGIALGVALATASVASLISGHTIVVPTAMTLYSTVLIADCVLRLRRRHDLRETRRWRHIGLVGNGLLIVAMVWNFWHSPISSGLPVFAAMMVLTMGTLYLALLLSGALSRSTKK